ncbi:MAG: sigma-70 family RNA polymerase sigma factor [Pirellulales bacterium]
MMDLANRQSDEWLMGQVARGSREHLAPLVRRYASPLLTYIQRMIGDRHRSEELFQEVFMAVWVKRKQYKFPRRFRAWLYAIATNRCRDDFRRTRTVTLGQFDDASASVLTGGNPSPQETAVAAETATLVDTAVARLSEQQRTVVVLRTWNGMSYAEIGEVVGCGESTARSYMHHALTSLRRFLEPRMREDG